MLTAVEEARVDKFEILADLDDETTNAMFNLFSLTKDGCDENAYELMAAAYTPGQKLSMRATAAYKDYGLTRPNGYIPRKIAAAIREAVALHYLKMNDSNAPKFKFDVPKHDCE